MRRVLQTLLSIGCSDFATLLADFHLADLNFESNMTVLAPTNEALANQTGPINQHILLTHFFKPQVFSSEIRDGTTVRAFNDEPLTFNLYNTAVFVSSRRNTSKVVEADIEALTDNVIHVIDSVLLPKILEPPFMPSNPLPYHYY